MKAQTRAREAAAGFELPNEAYALDRVPAGFQGDERSAPARLGRYARFQAADFVQQQGAIMVLIALVLSVPILGSYFAERHPPFHTLLQVAFASIASLLLPVGTLLATRGIVSNDTQHGYHRFLFSKPLDIGRYYTQAFGVKFAGFLALLALILLPFAFVIAPATIAATVGVAALFFILGGGLSFLLSTVTRHDTFFTVAIALVSGLVSDASRTPMLSWLRPLHWLLPPMEQLFRLLGQTVGRGPHPVGAGDVLWIAGYGVLCFVGGLAVLRRRALSA